MCIYIYYIIYIYIIYMLGSNFILFEVVLWHEGLNPTTVFFFFAYCVTDDGLCNIHLVRLLFGHVCAWPYVTSFEAEGS